MNDPDNTDDLKRLAPTLAGLSRQDPFVVPPDFFERFPQELQSRIAQERQARVIPIWLRRATIAVPLAAMLAGLLWYLGTDRVQDPEQMASISTPSVDDLSYADEAALLAELPDEALPALGGVDVELSEEELAAYIEHVDLDLTEYLAEP